MLSAVYYPHTRVRDENFLKHALLYWDDVEFISPSSAYDALPEYTDETMRELARIMRPRVPTSEEKECAHKRILALFGEDPLPYWLRVHRQSSKEERNLYNLCSGKLLDRTWRELERKELILPRWEDGVHEYASHTYLGLTIMAILAQCCAGQLKHTITDQDDSYFTMLKHLQFLSGEDERSPHNLDVPSQMTFRRWLAALAVDPVRAEDDARKTLVSISLEVINAESISVEKLLELRRDKAAFGTELRRNFAEAVESYVARLSEPHLSKTDAKTLTDEFRRKMELDLARLHEELRLVGIRTLLSKEVAVGITAPVIGGAVLTSTCIGTVLGGILGAAALGRVGTEYGAARNAVFGKHPMSFLYARKGIRLY
jgi:hypothetical protein